MKKTHYTNAIVHLDVNRQVHRQINGKNWQDFWNTLLVMIELRELLRLIVALTFIFRSVYKISANKLL